MGDSDQALSFEENLRRIEAEDPSPFGPIWKGAGSYFADLALAGEDIARAVPALTKAFHETHQVPVLEPIARALTAHFWHTGDVAALAELCAAAEYPTYVVEAFCDLIAPEQETPAPAASEDCTPFLPLLVRLYSEHERSILRVLIAYCRAGSEDRSRTLFVARLFADEEPAAAQLGAVLNAMKSEGLVIEECIPLLIAQLDPQHEFAVPPGDVVSALSYLARKGVDLGSWQAAIAERLASEDESEREQTAFVLTLARLPELSLVDPLLVAADAVVRRGALNGLVAARNQPERFGAAGLLLDRLVAGFADEELHALVLSVLSESALRDEFPTPESLRSLLVNPLAGPREDALSEYLAALLRSATGQARLAEVLAAVPPGASPVADRLRPFLGNAAENLEEGCSVCGNLPRGASYSYASDIPAAVADLTRIRDELYGCPECGTYYDYTYEEEWDDMSHDETWTLRRHSPTSARRALGDDESRDFEAYVVRTMALAESRLGHPLPKLRREGAWILAEHAVETSRAAWLAKLLESNEGALRLEAAEVVRLALGQSRKAAGAGHEAHGTEKTVGARAAPETLVALIEPLLSDEDERVRKSVASSLADFWIRTDVGERLGELLSSEDLPTLLAACTALWLAARGDRCDPTAYAPRLRELIAHPHEGVRRYARYALEQCAPADEEGSGEADTMAAYVAQLAADDSEARADALDALGDLEGPAAGEAVPHIAGALADEEVQWNAVDALKTLAQSGVDIAAALPALARALESSHTGNHGDIAWTIQLAAEQGADVEPVLESLFAAAAGDEQVLSVTLELLEAHISEGRAVPTSEEHLRRWMDRPSSDYYQERAVFLLVSLCVAAERFEDLTALLEHANKHVRGPAASRLADLVSEGARLGPVLPALAELTCDPEAQYARDSAAYALEKLAARSDAERTSVRGALEGCVSADLALSKEWQELFGKLGGQLRGDERLAPGPVPTEHDAYRAFVEAAERGDLEAVHAALAEGIPVDAPGDDGSSALNAAASAGRLEVAIALAEAGADLDHRGAADMSPLMNAVTSGHFALAEELLKRGATVSDDLLATVQLKVGILHENTAAGMVVPGAAESWQRVLEHLVAHRKRAAEEDGSVR